MDCRNWPVLAVRSSSPSQWWLHAAAASVSHENLNLVDPAGEGVPARCNALVPPAGTLPQFGSQGHHPEAPWDPDRRRSAFPFILPPMPRSGGKLIQRRMMICIMLLLLLPSPFQPHVLFGTLMRPPPAHAHAHAPGPLMICTRRPIQSPLATSSASCPILRFRHAPWTFSAPLRQSSPFSLTLLLLLLRSVLVTARHNSATRSEL